MASWIRGPLSSHSLALTSITLEPRPPSLDLIPPCLPLQQATYIVRSDGAAQNLWNIKQKTKLTWVHTLALPQVPRCGSGKASNAEAWVSQVTWACFWSGIRKLGAGLAEISIHGWPTNGVFPRAQLALLDHGGAATASLQCHTVLARSKHNL